MPALSIQTCALRTSNACPRLSGQPQLVAAAARRQAAVPVARRRQLLRCQAAADKEGDGSSSTQQQTAGTPAVPDTPPTPTGAGASQVRPGNLAWEPSLRAGLCTHDRNLRCVRFKPCLATLTDGSCTASRVMCSCVERCCNAALFCVCTTRFVSEPPRSVANPLFGAGRAVDER